MKQQILLLALTAIVVLAVPNSKAAPEPKAALDKSNCVHNLHLIYDAIQHYCQDHQKLPNWVSDLALPDEILICPAARAAGRTRAGERHDPRTTYTYEFNPRPLKGSPGRTQRDWKQMQMSLVGGVVPIVRCEQVHGTYLNLGFDGKIYESKLDWEDKYTNYVTKKELMQPRWLTPSVVYFPIKVPPRPPASTAAQLDLTDHYNAVLGKPWLPRNADEPDRELKGLKPELLTLSDVKFDVRGILQLSSSTLVREGAHYPLEVTNIMIGAACRRLFILVGAAHGQPGEVAASLRVHFEDGKLTREENLVMGQQVHLSWEKPNRTLRFAEIAWSSADENGGTLYLTTYENPARRLIRSLDLVANMGGSDLFVLAITSQ